MDSVVLDLRFALRSMRKAPGFTAVVVLAVALGIGANTVLFSVISFTLLRPLPYPDASRLVIFNEKTSAFPAMSVSWPDFVDWREAASGLFDGFGAVRPERFNLVGDGDPEQLTGFMATSEVLPLLGVRPQLGRLYSAGEDRPGAPRTVVVTHALWQRRFGSDPALVGRTLQLSGDSYTVVGVLPATFFFPVPVDVFVPLGVFADRYPSRTSHPGIYPIGRLGPGRSLRDVQRAFDSIAARLAAAHPENQGVGANVQLLSEFRVAAARPALLVLWGAVVLVLLIAAANVANLLLARATAREGEMAIRVALGAGRSRIVRQLLTESVLLSACGGIGGILLSAWALDALAPLLKSIPGGAEVHLDALALAFTAGVSVLTGVLFGLYPALHAANPSVHTLLQEARSSGTRGRLRGALVAAEVALAMVLLVGAGLLLRSFSRLAAVNPGFDASNTVTLAFSLPRARYPDSASILRFESELRRRAAQVPGVASVALAGGLPLLGAPESSATVDGEPAPEPGKVPQADVYVVTPEYLRTMRIPLLSGRFFEEGDRGRDLAVIDDSLARKFFGTRSPVGRRISGSEIIGVAGHVQNYALDGSGPVHIAFYLQLSEVAKSAPSWAHNLFLVARGELAAPALGEALRKAVREVDPQQAVSSMRTYEDVVSASLNSRRLTALLLGIFAGVALLLASVGIYGVIAYSVEQRTREIGIRMALGAQQGAVLRLVVGEGARLALAGIALGALGAFALSRALTRLLYGISATDPLTYLCLAAALAAVALFACWLPARRAVRVDPALALRAQ
jgi:putative ABC transport system permease protein